MNKPLLYCCKLSKNYKENHLNIQILKNINLIVQKGEMIAIHGHSGSGKSTLLHLLGGLEIPTQGEIIFEGKTLHKISKKTRALIYNKRLGFIHQFHYLLSDFSALENVAMPLMIKGEKLKNAKKIAKKMLQLVALNHRENHHPHELSGGERQRVAIARALIHQPTLILADEPTGNLDQQTANKIFQLLYQINKHHGTTFLVVTHDTSSNKYFHRKLELCHGKLRELA